ncbi:hypothetical protein LINGRAHAP2_LOCUS17350 [Linum grandiflorum]
MAYDSVSVAKEVFEKLGDEIQTAITMADLDSVSTAQQGFPPLLGVAEHSKLERLSVQVQRYGTKSILGLIRLINVCPRLHTLRLFFHIEYEIGTRPDVDVDLVKERRDSIKVVEVVGFRGYDIDYEFMEYVIEYFVGLEKIVINWSTTSFIKGKRINRRSKEQLCEAEKRALELKSRASPTVEFLVI